MQERNEIRFHLFDVSEFFSPVWRSLGVTEVSPYDAGGNHRVNYNLMRRSRKSLLKLQRIDSSILPKRKNQNDKRTLFGVKIYSKSALFESSLRSFISLLDHCATENIDLVIGLMHRWHQFIESRDMLISKQVSQQTSIRKIESNQMERKVSQQISIQKPRRIKLSAIRKENCPIGPRYLNIDSLKPIDSTLVIQGLREKVLTKVEELSHIRNDIENEIKSKQSILKFELTHLEEQLEKEKKENSLIRNQLREERKKAALVFQQNQQLKVRNEAEKEASTSQQRELEILRVELSLVKENLLERESEITNLWLAFSKSQQSKEGQQPNSD